MTSAKREPFRIPDLSNATVPFLVDDLADVRGQIKEMQKYEGILKARLQAERGDKTSLDGATHRVTFSARSRSGLSADKVIAKFGEDAVKDCYSTTDYVEMRTSEI